MTYLVINLTNYDKGYFVAGTYRSQKRAEALRDRLHATADSNDDAWRVIPIHALDGYVDDSVVEHIGKHGEIL